MITTNTLTLSGYDKTADAILSLIDDLGFTTDRAFDELELRRRIVWAIVSNTTSAPAKNVDGEIITVEAEEQEPTDEDLEQMLAELKEEDEQEQGNFYNTCPHCGQLVR